MRTCRLIAARAQDDALREELRQRPSPSAGSYPGCSPAAGGRGTVREVHCLFGSLSAVFVVMTLAAVLRQPCVLLYHLCAAAKEPHLDPARPGSKYRVRARRVLKNLRESLGADEGVRHVGRRDLAALRFSSAALRVQVDSILSVCLACVGAPTKGAVRSSPS